MEQKKTAELLPQLYKTIAGLDSPEACQQLLEDLCTYKELENMAARLEAARLLLEGKTYTEVIQSIEISSATLSRVSKCVRFGKGYASALYGKEGSSENKRE